MQRTFQNRFQLQEKKLQEQLEAKDNVEIILGVTVDSIVGEDTLSGIVIKKTADGREITLNVDGMFVAIGLVPQNEAFANVLKLDERGYADSSEDCKTVTDGIFVAGDCRKKDIRQVTTAVADGAVAALAAIKFLEDK